MRKQVALLLFLLLISSQLLAQSFYMGGADGKLSRVTLNGTDIAFQSIDNECSVGVGSMAVYKNIIYYSSGATLRKAIITGNRLTQCEIVDNVVFSGNALTVDKNGILYGASGNKLFKIDPLSGTRTDLGTMPYYSGGDLIFYKDQLYLASVDGVVKVNIPNPALSQLVLPDVGIGFGMAVVPFNSSKNKVYLFDGTGSITEIDLENNSIVNKFYNDKMIVYDAGSVVENGSVAKLQIDSIQKYADCPATGKGTIEVICYNKLEDYTFELNGITNTTGVFPNLSPGTFHITLRSALEVKDTVITVDKFLFEKPAITVNTVDNLCEELGKITLNTSSLNNSLYTIIYNNLSYGINRTYTNLKAGTHRFIVLNKAGCAVDTIDVVLNKCDIKPDGADIQQECSSVFKASVRIKTKPHLDGYTFKIGNTSNTTGFFTGLAGGTYTATISSAEDTAEMDFIVPDYEAMGPVISYKTTNAVCEKLGSVTFSMIGDAMGYTIKLNGKSYPFLHEFKLDAGTYTFAVFKPDGCLLNLYNATLTKIGCDDLILPNTFTPNNDGVNDVFEADKSSKAVNYTLKIYSRNGELLFTSFNVRAGWDGTYKGRSVAVGVYYYVVTYTNNRGSNLTNSGVVNLIR